MATLLHQQLKEHYVANSDQHEVMVGKFRIDAVDSRGRLIEIQCASLSAIRNKIATLVEDHQVTVVKPLAARKKIVTLHRRGGDVVSSRYSPVRQSVAHVFLELVHFGIFPHPRLQLDLLLTEQEETRVPPGPRTPWRKKYSIDQRKLLTVQEHLKLRTALDLWKALDVQVPAQFTTSDLVETAGMPRWLAQKATFCFRRMGFLTACGKQGNTIVYELTKPVRRKIQRAA